MPLLGPARQGLLYDLAAVADRFVADCLRLTAAPSISHITVVGSPDKDSAPT